MFQAFPLASGGLLTICHYFFLLIEASPLSLPSPSPGIPSVSICCCKFPLFIRRPVILYQGLVLLQSNLRTSLTPLSLNESHSETLGD